MWLRTVLQNTGVKADKPCDFLKRGILPHKMFRVHQRHIISSTVQYSNTENMPHCETEELYYRGEQIRFSAFSKPCHESKANSKNIIKILYHDQIETDTCVHSGSYTTHMPLLSVVLHDSKGFLLQQFINLRGNDAF
jgi:hypothetical protein